MYDGRHATLTSVNCKDTCQAVFNDVLMFSVWRRGRKDVLCGWVFFFFLFSCLHLNRYQLCAGKCPDCGLAHRLQQRWFLQAVRVPPRRGDAEKQHLQVGTGPPRLRVKLTG